MTKESVWSTGYPSAVSIAESSVVEFMARPIRAGKCVGPVVPQIANLFGAFTEPVRSVLLEKLNSRRLDERAA